MKFKKILFSIFMVFMSTLIVYADVPDSITINGSNLRYIDASQMLPNVDTTDGANDGQNLSIKLTTDNRVTYCVSPDKLLYTAGSLTYSKGNKLGNEIVYVMEHDSYLNEGGGTDKDYFITNLAIWYLLAPGSNKLANYDFPNGKYKNTVSDTVQRAYSLAIAARNYSPTSDTITVSNSNMTMTLSGDYYVTSSITPDINGVATTYKINLNNAPTGTKVTDTSGTEKTSFNKNAAFIIKVPKGSVSAATSFTVTVSTDFTDREAYVYNPTGGHDTQAVVLLTSKTASKSTNITLNITVDNTTSIQVSKRILGTTTALSGAEFNLVKETQIIDTWTSGTSPHPVSNLSNGRYTLTETVTPNGYVEDNKVVVFDINDGVVTKVSGDATINGTTIIIYNEKVAVVGEVIVSKQDDKGNGLAGAKLELYNSSGQKIYTWTSKETPEVISNLSPGTYTIKEVSAPNKYVKNKDNITFTVRADGTASGTIVIKNYPDEVDENQQTGGFVSVIMIILGLSSLGCATWFLLKDNKCKEN